MASKNFIPYAQQWIEEDDIASVVRVLKSDWLTTGPEVAAFEKELASYCGARYAVACSSGTAALHLACMALGLGPGDAIVTSPITFLATANCARFTGADVLFSDVTPGTVNLDPGALEQTLDKAPANKIKAIFPLHFAGHPAEMERIWNIAQTQGLKIIEDACHALGARYTTQDGHVVSVGSCRHSHMTVFSFHPVKHITLGEGGAITTNDESTYDRLRKFRNHGMTYDRFIYPELGFSPDGDKNPWYYEMGELGYNYRITDIQCALGRSQLTKIDRFLKRRKEIAADYRQQLSKVFGNRVSVPEVLPGYDHAYHLYPVRMDFDSLGCARATVMNLLKEKGIGTQVHYIPVHLQPYYRKRYGTGPGDFPVAESYYKQCLSLPMYPAMQEDDVKSVVEALESIFCGVV